ncbi:alpha/beta fold hydrolase [Halegenticoccus tardaugens]|uniref:alpha/beta fold hydrolase n=1 Tax=Halegenticoccus tardaugens TaxID=2071624 RepID=UPI00100C1AC5|nr:alpha/beta hydrolase [Halegenticoccus tardaugens]
MTDYREWSSAQETTTAAVDGHDDLRVAYYEAGRENDGPPVVFLHGIPTWSFLWRDVVDAVADERRVVAPDLLGYGNSEMRDGFDRSIRAQEAMLAGLLDRLGAESVSLVGHDIGGGVALRYAAHEPEAVRELVLSNAVCYDSWPVEFVSGLGVPGTVESWEDAELNGKLDFVFEDGLYADEPNETFVEGMKAPWLSPEGRTALSRAAVATNTNHTTELDYAAITADALLLWGAEDVLQPISYAERLAADLTGDADLVALDGAYHWVVEDRPDAYRDHLRSFLVPSEGVGDE